MTAPIWVTPPGDLGTVVEGEFYQIQLNATNANSYKYLSGVLPDGIRVTANGVVEGNPKNYDYIQGTPSEVAKDVTSKFVVRAVSLDGTVADRVFEMTVTGQDAPVIDATPASDLGVYFDGDLVDVQLTATDPDPNDNLTWSLQSGNIPSGVTVSSTGNIYGYIDPFADVDGTPGFDATNFDMSEWDFRTKAVNKNYEFTVQVTDGKDVDFKTYSLYAISRNAATADMDLVTADNIASSNTNNNLNKMLDASQTNLRRPALLTQSTGLGRVKHQNNFNFQFVGKDFDGDTIDYLLSSGSLPTGLSLDTQSGFLTGTLPSFSSTETSFTFSIQVRKRNLTQYISDATSFTIIIEGDIDSTVTWPDSTMTIKTGEQSQLDVVASISDGTPVQYELKSGVNEIIAGNFVIGQEYTIVSSGNTDFISIGSTDNKVGTKFIATDIGAGTGTASLGTNKLPQGLRLNSDGFIVGRVSFETLMFDTGTTSFDDTQLYINETTFENTYSFVARVFSTDGKIDTHKKFTINVVSDTNKPYDSVYAIALPSQTQRDIYDSLIQNNDDIPLEDVYRSSDYAFGIQKDIRALIMTGLSPTNEDQYISAMNRNFSNNILRFGEFKTARALNTDGTTKYEIVYIALIDKKQGVDSETGLSKSPALRQDLRSASTWTNPMHVSESMPDVSHSHYLASQDNDYYAYPNSIENMRSRLGTNIGFQILERKVLPNWMQDKQENDTVLGWTLAAPIVYCKPGTAEKIKYRLEERVKTDSLDIKKISFEIDRFILDNNLSKHYNKLTNSYDISQETSFDLSTSVTTFDGDGTRFFARIDTYVDKDEGDLYIKFPQVGVFDRLPYTER
tara:strand:+ start:2515 stop:5055 length:2541 start_codon:yes stop_codon:yes gene_type:complete